MTKIIKPVANSASNLSDDVSEKIKELIISSKLKPGDKLPNETSLCEMLNVSRGTLRESIKILASRNIITIVRGVGTFVSDKPGITEDPLGFGFVQDKTQLMLDLMDLRMIIEPSLVKLASKNATKSEIHRLEELESEIEKAYASNSDSTSYDVEFHSQIASCSHNQVVEIIFPILTSTIPAIADITHKSLMMESTSDHRAIIQAIKDKNSDLAEKLMEQHLKRNTVYLSEIINQSNLSKA